MKKYQTHIGLPKEICQEHGIIDVLPCPWPDCPNGIKESTFVEESLFGREKNRVYTRRKWNSSIGGDYYTWDSNDLPNWFSVGKTFRNEVRRLQLSRKSHPQTIYHYTSLQGLVGIVEKNAFWLSDYSYLNDRKELIHGAELIERIISHIERENNNANVKQLLETWKINLHKSSQRVCIASFSEDGDSLSQWRAYGSVAIGFDPMKLTYHAYQGLLQPVEYQYEVQEKMLQLLIQHLIQAYVIDSTDNRLEKIPDVYHSTYSLFEVIAFFKDQAFCEEKEYRLAFIEYDEKVYKVTGVKPPKHFRTTDNSIVPYIYSDELFQIQDQKDEKRPMGITEVVLGPQSSDLMRRGVKEFLAENELEKIKVVESKVPFRVS